MSKASRHGSSLGRGLKGRLARRGERNRRVLRGEQLESRVLLAGDLGFNPYHNYDYNVDVDGNFVASPRDALLVLRAIETRGAGPLVTGSGGGEGEDSADQSTYRFDTNDDAYLAPSDFLRVVNYLNSGEGAPGDIVEFELRALTVNLNPLPNNTVQQDEDFVLAAFVKDNRRFPTGVFAGFLDVAYSNPSAFSVVFSEWQRIILPKDTFSGTFQLTLDGQTSAPIDVGGNVASIVNNIRTAAEGLSGIGAGNVQVIQRPIFNEQTQAIENPFVFELRFINQRFEQDLNQLCIPGGTLTDNNLCVGAGSNITTEGGPNTITIEELAKGVATDPEAFRRSFITGPDYPNGLTAEDGDRNLQGDLTDPNVFSEVGSFDGSGFPSGTEGDQRLLWTVRLNADAAGMIVFTGNPADTPVNSDVLVFGQEDAIPTDMIDYNAPAGIPLTVTIVADIVAMNDSFVGANSVSEDSSNNPLNVLANDSTLNGTLTITGVSNISNGGTVNVVNGGTSLSYTPVPNFFGVETFNYTISNGVGGTATATVTVNVFEVNDAPVAGDDSKAATENTPLVFPLSDLLANDVVGPATPAPNETATQVFTSIVFSAGSRGGTINVNNQGTGTLADDTVTYTPAMGVTGIETFTYTVTDNGTTNGAADPRNDMATLTINVSDVNSPPVANDDMLDGTEDVVQNIAAATLLQNDNAGDPGQTVTVVSVAANSAEGGTVSLNGTTITYTPPQHYFGTDSFTYTINDNGVPVLSDSATVFIDLAPVNDPPIAMDDLNISVDELSMAADNPIDVLANDSPGPMEEGIDTLTIISVTQPANGVAAINDNGTPGNPADDFVTYQPDPDFVDATDTFTYTIRDSGGLTDTATVSVDVVPALRPRARNVPATTSEGAGGLTVDVLANVLPNPGEDPTLISFTQGTHGTVTLNDNGTPSLLTDDVLIYTPNDPNFNGTDSFTYTANDTAAIGVDSTATVNVTVTAVNDQPTLVVPGQQMTNEDTAVVINGVSVDDIDKNFVVNPFNLEVSLAVASGRIGLASTGGLNFTSGGNNQASMTFRGTIAALNTALASLSYTPNLNFAGADSLNVSVSDLGNVGTPGPLSANNSVPINVVAQNDAPDLTVPGNQTTVRDIDLVFNTANGNRISVMDVDSDPDDLRMVLSVTSGRLILSTTAGLTFVSGANNSAAMTIEGTQSELNAALNGMIYRPNAGFFGNDTLNASVDDLGNNGAGASGTDNGAVPIAVQNFVNSTLSGTTYVDRDQNRVVGAAELRLSGLEVQLAGTNMLGEAVSRTTTTDMNGNYSFANVVPGTYQLQLISQVVHMIDAQETVGNQGGHADHANDLIMNINIPQLGLGVNGGANNNFGKLGLRAEFVSIIDTFASSTGDGMLFGTDRAGNQFWQSLLGSTWSGVTGASATLSQDLSTVTIQIQTQNNGTQTRVYSIRDQHIRVALDQQGGAAVRIDGTPADLGFQLSANGGAGEGEAARPVPAPARDVCEAEQYAAAVDRVLAEANWA
ncbi:MAG: tandem-95 repeat protein [Pirellulaceae bacterium]|nr:tandem-95 repeat protein [Pirellulaceae bacterium]